MLLELVIFYVAAVIAIGAALLMILQRNPVASVLYLIVSLLAQATLYIQLSAMFVGAILVIVYAGAILVLFLFVIMLLNLRGEQFEEKRPRLGRATKMVISLALLVELLMIVKQTAFPERMDRLMVEATPDFGSVKPVAELLYTQYLYPFELTSILLLVAIVGAVIMAKRGRTDHDEEDK